MSTIHMGTSDKAVVDIAKKAFPNYNGKMFKIYISDQPINCASYWDGGSREYFKFVNLIDLSVSEEVPAQSMFDKQILNIDKVVLPPNIVCVKHSIFRGKDYGLTIIANSNSMSKYLPEKPNLSYNDKIVLHAAKSLKSNYAGISNYRFHQANRYTNISQEDYDNTKTSLIERKLLTATGAISNLGRNAVNDIWNWPKKED